MMGSTKELDGAVDSRPVLFFDIDNCLYSRSAKVHDMMVESIDRYFTEHLGLPEQEANRLHQEYYRNYGLAIEGLVRHHQIDPIEYNEKVDDALPLEGVIKPDPKLRQLLEDIDRRKAKPWLLTNAYVNHARRVVRLLAVEDLFEGLTYCDYGSVPIICKPHRDMYVLAMRQAGVERMEDCYFVDDSYQNCASAMQLGWTTAHLVEEGLPKPHTKASQFEIQRLDILRDIFPRFFKSSGSSILSKETEFI